jgi:hypothetical protein
MQSIFPYWEVKLPRPLPSSDQRPTVDILHLTGRSKGPRWDGDPAAKRLAALCNAKRREWHKASFAATHHFVAYWSNNGQRLTLGPDSSAANDPKRTCHAAYMSRLLEELGIEVIF